MLGKMKFLYTEDGQYAASNGKGCLFATSSGTFTGLTYEKQETPGCETIASCADSFSVPRW